MNLYIWRHPKPLAAAGICLGQTDMGVSRRKLKRLANQIQRFAQFHNLPKIIWVSPLQRSLKVGELLTQRGFECRVAPNLMELDFGTWDGQPWTQIPKQEIDDWCDNFAYSAPYNGESVERLFARVEARVKDWLKSHAVVNNDEPILAVGHAGWINVVKMRAAKESIPQIAADWPRPVAYRELSILRLTSDF